MLCIVSALGLRAQETPENDGVYYIYNETNKLFLTRGGNWGTQAVAKPIGMPWKVSITDGKCILRMYDLTVAGSTTGFGDNCYSDNGSPLQFTLAGNATDGFTIKSGDNYITCPESANPVSLSTTTSSWKFLTQAQYDAVLATNVANQESAIATLKSITIPNGKTLSDVVTNVNEWAASATVNDGVPTSSNWTPSKHDGRGGNVNWNSSYGTEMYQCGNGHYTRTITGLKKGIYKVSVRGMKRMGNNATCMTMGNAGYPVSDSYLSANGYIIRIKAWYEDRAGNENPNNTGDFVNIVNNGGYITEGFVYVGDEGKLELDASSEAYWGGSWFLFNGISYTFYNNEVSDEDIAALVATIPAEETIPASVYNNLTSLRNTLESTKTIAAYNDLTSAVTTAIALVAPYATLKAEIVKAKALGIAAATADAYADVSTAEEAIANTQSLKVDEYNYVTGTYQYGVELGTWTTTGPTGSLSGQHYKGSDYSYLEQSGSAWGQNSWTIKYAQDLTLPEGNYVFKVAGRQANSDGVTLSLTVKNGDTVLGTVADFPKGDTGLGINTSGVTDFTTGKGHEYVNGGNGRGWEWRYVKFTLASNATVNVSVDAVATTSHMWVSFCDATVQTDSEANISLIAYNIALGSAQTVIADNTYENVIGSERTDLQTAINADNTLDKTNKDAIDAATEALDIAREAFVNAKSAYDSYVAAKEVVYENNLPYASDTKFAAIATAQAADDATSASDATLKTNAIISAYRKYVESNALAEGVTGAEPITIQDPNMEVTYDGTDHTFGAWQVFGQTDGNIQLLSGESFTDGDGKNDYKYADIWKSDNNAGIKQSVNLAPGKYLLTATARAATTAGATFGLFAGEARTEINRIGNTGGVFDRGWNDVSVEFDVTETSDIEIGVQSGNGKDLWWSATRFRLVKLADIATLKITDAQYSTFVASFDVTIPEGVTATKITGVAGAKLTEEEVTTTIPANTPVVLFSESPVEQKCYGKSVPAEDLTEGMLTGTYERIAAPNGCYILQKQGDKVGFFKVDTSVAQPYVPAYRAYLTVPTGTDVKAFYFGENADAIQNIEAETEQGVIYNLAGQRVSKATKGIFIKNGKKVVVK